MTTTAENARFDASGCLPSPTPSPNSGADGASPPELDWLPTAPVPCAAFWRADSIGMAYSLPLGEPGSTCT